MVDHRQNAVPHRYAGPLGSPSSADLVVLRREVVVFSMACHPASFGQRCLQPSVSFAPLSAEPLAGALVIAWAHAGPRRQVFVVGETTHVRANLGDDDLSHPAADSRNLLQLLQLRQKRDAQLRDLVTKSRDLPVQLSDVPQLLAEQPALRL